MPNLQRYSRSHDEVIDMALAIRDLKSSGNIGLDLASNPPPVSEVSRRWKFQQLAKY